MTLCGTYSRTTQYKFVTLCQLSTCLSVCRLISDIEMMSWTILGHWISVQIISMLDITFFIHWSCISIMAAHPDHLLPPSSPTHQQSLGGSTFTPELNNSLESWFYQLMTADASVSRNQTSSSLPLLPCRKETPGGSSLAKMIFHQTCSHEVDLLMLTKLE